MRGKHGRSVITSMLLRITPAGAGKTRACKRTDGSYRDHPRRCGENGFSRFRKTSRHGITPAGAGKTDPIFALTVADEGSPPQVRGKLKTAVTVSIPVGITPAGAGKTWQCTVYSRERWDHPRRCGENFNKWFNKLSPRGSPPQVRGKQLLLLLHCVRARITPAGAGKTNRSIKQAESVRDHPRRCGENVSGVPSLFMPLGSPPQVRGKLSCCSATRNGLGITPAGAGKTCLACVCYTMQ